MKCLINSVKNSSSKKKKKIPTYLPYFCSARYANITIFFFWPKLCMPWIHIEHFSFLLLFTLIAGRPTNEFCILGLTCGMHGSGAVGPGIHLESFV